MATAHTCHIKGCWICWAWGSHAACALKMPFVESALWCEILDLLWGE